MDYSEMIDKYIMAFSPDIQVKLNELRSIIRRAAPDAVEKISYQMPTFALYGNLVHFAAFKKHIGFYPAPSGIEAFKDELASYKFSKGAVQFPLDESIPYELIERIVKFRVDENTVKAEEKKKLKQIYS